jgi:hypothetical protein
LPPNQENRRPVPVLLNGGAVAGVREKLGTLPGFGNTLLIMHANAAQNWAASLVFLLLAS